MSRALESTVLRSDAAVSDETETDRSAASRPTFADVYRQSARAAWRTLRRLGVHDSELDDAMQDVFLVVHRRLKDLQPDVPALCWVCGIAVRVARDHRRSAQRRDPSRRGLQPVCELDAIADMHAQDPEETAQRRAAGRLIREVLEELEEPKREVFVFAELEQMTAPQIAQILDVPLNTVYSRLRAARRDFEAALALRSRPDRSSSDAELDAPRAPPPKGSDSHAGERRMP